MTCRHLVIRWSWEKYFAPKHWQPSTKQHGVTSYNTVALVLTVVKPQIPFRALLLIFAFSKCSITNVGQCWVNKTSSSFIKTFKPTRQWNEQSNSLILIKFFRLLGHYTAWDSFKITFRKYLAVPSSRVKLSFFLDSFTLKYGNDR